MKHQDFYIGLEFVASGGFRWRCTDVGTRTILAIQLNGSGQAWHEGPPYIAMEVVFDELELTRCHLTDADALVSAASEYSEAAHPGYSTDAIIRMTEAQIIDRYPHRGVMRFDRRRPDGEILHPYAGRRVGNIWLIELYLPFKDCYDEMTESDFIDLPRASEQDIRARANSHSDL